MASDANEKAQERDGGAGGGPIDTSGSKAGWVLLVLAGLMAAASIAYNVFEGGSREEQAEALADAAPTIDELRAAAEVSRDNAQPWSDLAFAYFERGDFAEAALAYERAVAIDNDDAVLWSALGESLTYASARAPLPAEALNAFERALELNPADPRARYFMAVKKDLEGDHEGSIAAWLDLLEDSPPGAPWENDLVRTIRQVGAINDIDVEPRLAKVMDDRTPSVAMPGSDDIVGTGVTANLRGPDAQQVAEASRLPPGEQRAMAEGMVERLDARLQEEPGNLDGWVMLMRSRMTLGQPDRARAALAAAIAANPSEAGDLRTQAQRLGIQ